jgi:hypothetical protein
MKREKRISYPNIVPCLVMPFEKTCMHGSFRYEALCFAQRGSVVLFAAEYARRFGVAVLDSAGEVEESDEYPTLDMAARVFLAAQTTAACTGETSNG